jgi:hypothetical protein
MFLRLRGKASVLLKNLRGVNKEALRYYIKQAVKLDTE